MIDKVPALAILFGLLDQSPAASVIFLNANWPRNVNCL